VKRPFGAASSREVVLARAGLLDALVRELDGPKVGKCQRFSSATPNPLPDPSLTTQ
jgi:hypothetical protein